MPENEKPLAAPVDIYSAVCYERSFVCACYYGSVALCLVFFADNLSGVAEKTLVYNQMATEGGILFYLIQTVVFVLSVIFFPRLFSVEEYRGDAEKYVGKTSYVMLALVVAVTALLDVFEFVLEDFPFGYRVVFTISEAIYGLIMLFIDFALLRQGGSEAELSVVRQMWHEDRKHYEIQKENMEIIEIKCHDLKHQIQRIAKNGGLNDKMIDEIENSIYIYDSIMKTGSEVLDVILSGFSLRCQKSNVVLTCMADGNGIRFMDEIDVYSLFGNLLENALEYEQKVEPPENRFISMTVKEQNGFLSVHCENYYQGGADVSQGVIATSKSDKNYHGFGIKSMKKITEKYDGTFNIEIQDDMFQVDILLPVVSGAKGDNA